MKVIVVAGARPNFMKVSPIIAAMRSRGHDAVLVHTGQHYDPAMSDAFFTDLGMAPPDHHLDVGSGSQAEQTSRVLERFDPVLMAEKPDWVLVVGDVNSTLAASLATAKRRSEIGVRLVHVEAGLRSGDWSMPEEVNRVLTDQLSDLLLTHSPEAAGNLVGEGIPEERTAFVGNVMMDALFDVRARGLADTPWVEHGLESGGYGLVTLHRPSNVDSRGRLKLLLAALRGVAEEMPLLWPVHPRARRMMEEASLSVPDGLTLIEPVGYRVMSALMDHAKVVITDSGGLQEETTALGVPCVTVRESTERPITVDVGTNRLVPWPPSVEGVYSTVMASVSSGRGPGSRAGDPPGWDGKAAGRVVDAMESATWTTARSPKPESATQ